jgi:hypothetical protein
MAIQFCKFQEILFRIVVIYGYLLLPLKINALIFVTPCISGLSNKVSFAIPLHLEKKIERWFCEWLLRQNGNC